MRLNYNESSWSTLAFTRFLMAIVVLVVHLQTFGISPGALHFISRFGGKAAVLGFLIVSGISIGFSYKSKAEGFISRRFLRIYPLYIISVLFTIVVQLMIGSPYQLPGQTMATAGVATSIANLFFLQGFLAITIIYNGPLWSIAVEVFYYALAPLFIRLKAYALAGLVLLSMLVFYLFLPKQWIYGENAVKFAWPWLIGFLLVTKRVNTVISISFMALGVCLAYVVLSNGKESLSYLTFAVVCLVVLLIINERFALPVAVDKIFNFLGELSYPLYLFHFPLFMLLYFLGIKNPSWIFVLTLLIIIPVNYLFDHWLKRVFWKPFVAFINTLVTRYHLKPKAALLPQPVDKNLK